MSARTTADSMRAMAEIQRQARANVPKAAVVASIPGLRSKVEALVAGMDDSLAAIADLTKEMTATRAAYAAALEGPTEVQA